MGDLHAAVHADIFKGSKDCFLRFFIQVSASAGERKRAHCESRKSVVRIEFSRHSHTDSAVERSVDGEFDPHEIMV